MRNVLLTSLVCASALLVGCEQAFESFESIGSNQNDGTPLGISACVERNKVEYIDESIIFKECVKRHENPYSTDVTGNLNVTARSFVREGLATIIPSGINRNQIVVTSLGVQLNVFDEEGVVSSGSVIIDDLWISPDESFEAFGRIEESFPQIPDGSSCNDMEERKSCWSWSFTEIWGVPLLSDWPFNPRRQL